jgi:3-(3-hydroxy-phenyl)propionate hydroxylase
VSRTFRDAVLGLAKRHAFARKLVNSGRLSLPHVHAASPLNTHDASGESFASVQVPGAPAADAPVRGPGSHWFLDYVQGGFTLVAFGDAVPAAAAASLAHDRIPCRVVRVGANAGGDGIALEDRDGLLRERYDGKPGTCYLFRPDQHIAARWRRFDADAVRRAIAHATAND